MEFQNPLHPKTSYGIADGGGRGPTVAGEEEGHGNGDDDRETLSATISNVD